VTSNRRERSVRENEAAVPLRLELGALDDQRLTVQRIMHKHAAVGHFGQDEEPPVAPLGNPRQRHSGEASPIAGDAPCLQP